MIRCPGQDLRFWTPDDIYDIQCPFCKHQIEFWKDEPFRYCPNCKNKVRNPKIDLGCARWCNHADKCLQVPQDGETFDPVTVFERLKTELTRKQLLADKDISRIEKIMHQNIDYAEQSDTSPLIIKCSVLLSAVFMYLEKARSRNSVETTDFNSMLDDILGSSNLSSNDRKGIQNIVNIILNDNEIKDNKIASICHKVKAILDII